MKTRADDFSGLTVAMITPFKEGKIDFDALQEQVEFQVAAGTTAVSPTGTTGESPTLTHEEQHEVIKKTVEFAAGRVKVLAGTGSNSTAEALSLSKYAESVGADALLVIGPYYNKPTQEGFYQHFKAIAQAVGVPICVYNVPGRTGKAIDADTIIRLAEFDNIAMVKDATGSMDSASRIIAATDLTVLSGDDSLTLPFMALGARGVVSVVGNFAPKDVVALCAAMNAGNLDEARALHQKLLPLSCGTLSLATNPIPVKKAMQLLGRDSGEMRLPMTELESAPTEKLRRLLVDYGLLAE
ncbi:MAG: 4-hydroxy-tetrahydrodipicolinate synthase [Thermoguttaceae bacterium]|nr:4-hydroxy-tetrahydrodipicolinate synthase [Thermoguttaceae bacterium]MBR5759722.1 4-hydroxy-tetrahydrodipicolinate synthase [Thermoguttaceae bacterium]